MQPEPHKAAAKSFTLFNILHACDEFALYEMKSGEHYSAARQKILLSFDLIGFCLVLSLACNKSKLSDVF